MPLPVTRLDYIHCGRRILDDGVVAVSLLAWSLIPSGYYENLLVWSLALFPCLLLIRTRVPAGQRAYRYVTGVRRPGKSSVSIGILHNTGEMAPTTLVTFLVYVRPRSLWIVHGNPLTLAIVVLLQPPGRSASMVPGTTSPPPTPCNGMRARAGSIGQAVIAFPTSYAMATFNRSTCPGKEASRWAGPIGTMYGRHLPTSPTFHSCSPQYKLDDDLDFHNSAELSTTVCPLLPGQLVNVLHVPFALSSSRSRNDSLSSTSSEFRTMNPTDKFLNPRPVPAKPSLPRLKTSPTLPQEPWSSTTSPASARGRSASSRGPSQPSSASALRVMRMTKRSSVEEPSRSLSRGSNRSVGIIGAIRALTSPRTTSPDAGVDRGRPATTERTARIILARATSARSVTPKRSALAPTSPIAELDDRPSSGPSRDLALRKEFADEGDSSAGMTIPSFAQHRRQRSLSRDQSSLRHSLSRRDVLEQNSLHELSGPCEHLETLKEVASPTNTPLQPPTAIKVLHHSTAEGQSSPDLEKRLPTLPNSPSSAYPPSAVDESPTQRFCMELENLQSHFSSTTIETGSYTDSYINNERSHFSDWTCGTTRHSLQSEYAPSIIDFEPISPPIDAEFESRDIKLIDVGEPVRQDGLEMSGPTKTTPGELPTAPSFSTINSVASTTPESHVDLSGAKEEGVPWSKFQHYSLPTEDHGSGATAKPISGHPKVAPLVVDTQLRPAEFQGQRPTFDGSAMPHSTSMQELLDELSYLGDIIRHH